MIVSNWIAKIIVNLAGRMTPGTLGVTLWPFIFIYPEKWAKNKRLVKHEKKHLEQYKRYWIIGFLPIYIYYHVKYGFLDNPLEIEARASERKS